MRGDIEPEGSEVLNELNRKMVQRRKIKSKRRDTKERERETERESEKKIEKFCRP